MSQFRLDSDDDAEMTAPQPVDEYVESPELAEWDHASLFYW